MTKEPGKYLELSPEVSTVLYTSTLAFYSHCYKKAIELHKVVTSVGKVMHYKSYAFTLYVHTDRT